VVAAQAGAVLREEAAAVTREEAEALAERMNESAPERVRYEAALTEHREVQMALERVSVTPWFVRRVTDRSPR
jgi:hypothetical protein